MIKGINFDCDGTLVDSELLFNRALSLKLAERGLEISASQLVSRFRGAKLAEVLTTIEQEHAIHLNDGFVQQYRNMVARFFADELQPCEGVKDTLKEINLPMTVVSNGPLEKIQMALKITGLDGFFGNYLFSAYEIGVWKPNPGLFLYASQKMGLRADQCLVVEDSIVGIEGALAANMHAILYDPKGEHTNYYHNADERFKEKVIRVQHFTEILQLIH